VAAFNYSFSRTVQQVDDYHGVAVAVWGDPRVTRDDADRL
jgi:hypothetical protein